MSDFVLHRDDRTDYTLVSNLFLDEYMPSANGEYVKIYLYLLRCLRTEKKDLSISVIADKFEHTESDVNRALKYWEKMRLLKLEYNGSRDLSGIYLLDGTQKPAASAACEPKKLPERTDVVMPKTVPPAPLTQEELKQLLFICEQYLGKTLSSTDVSKILYFHDSLGFCADLIEYLVEYCVSKKHKSMRYIESVALAWHEEGYSNVSQAKEQTNTYSKAYFAILKAFGISNRNPVEAEISYMNRWIKELGFSQELITEACGRTMAAIHQPSFEYADKILCTWQKHQVHTPADLAELDKKHASSRARNEAQQQTKKPPAPNRFHNFRERDYNFEELEKQLINN